MKKQIYVYFLLIFFTVGCGNKKTKDGGQNDSTLFVLLDNNVTHVDFVNEVEDQELFNILTYRNFYNGGGVAIGDINNDSLPEIFFTSNLKENRLYLNKGNLVFEDISESAGIFGTRGWSTGVTMADVNGDGLLDIYVCNSGDIKGDDRVNELYINNGDLTFTEKAREYNLDHNAFTTHASFFDYDQDGDLDCYLLNNSFVDPSKLRIYENLREEVDSLGGDKLMRNDGDIFTDVTLEAKIFTGKIGFGLGVSVSDINNDNLPDIYISNDFWERDYLYINNGNGTFSEKLKDMISVCSLSSMGADVADINNDGLPEIFTTDMLAADNYRLKAMTLFDEFQLEDSIYRAIYHYQILQNCLQLNNSGQNFQEIGFLSGVSATDWSWGALIFDFENDGYKDIFVSNGITRDIMYLDFTEFISNRENVKKIVVSKGKFDWRDFVPMMPSNPLKNYAFKNNRDLQFNNIPDELGFGKPSFSNGSIYGDLDNDGDYDLVINNVNMPCFIYENQSDKLTKSNYLKVYFNGHEKNKFGIGSTVKIYYKGEIQANQNYSSRGFQSSTAPNINFGLGKVDTIDSIEVIWPDNKMQIIRNIAANRSIVVNYRDASLTYKNKVESNPKYIDYSDKLLYEAVEHKENKYHDFLIEPLNFRQFSSEGPELLTGDINSDNREDFILLGSAGQADKVFIQDRNGRFRRLSNVQIEKDSLYESTCGELVDLNNDGNLDLVIGSGGNEIKRGKKYFNLRVYLNNGNGKFTKGEEIGVDIFGNFSTIKSSDFDGDGFMDLFIGGRLVPGNYGIPPNNFLLKNVSGQLRNVTPPNIGGVGMVTDALWSDFDSDGDDDLIVIGDWMPVTIFFNDSGQFNRFEKIDGSSGWWNAIEADDLDNDGDIDFVLGNWGLNTKFKASGKEPLLMFVKDFDGNGKSEAIINWYPPLDDQAFPFVTKAEMSKQLPVLKKEILKYEDYANKTYRDLFTESMRENALEYKANNLQTSILRNNNGQYILETLPVQAQISPVFSITIFDFNKDGLKDIWLGGNFYGLKPQVGRNNSSRGVLLQATLEGNYQYLQPHEYGIYVEGEVRDSKMIKVSGEDVFFVARNNHSLICFKESK